MDQNIHCKFLEYIPLYIDGYIPYYFIMLHCINIWLKDWFYIFINKKKSWKFYIFNSDLCFPLTILFYSNGSTYMIFTKKVLYKPKVNICIANEMNVILNLLPNPFYLPLLSYRFIYPWKSSHTHAHTL